MPPRVEDVRFRMECVREGVSSKCAGVRRGEGGCWGIEVCSKGLRGLGRYRGGDEDIVAMVERLYL
jgi:hypothetical protein